jgi:hypothetical protein
MVNMMNVNLHYCGNVSGIKYVSTVGDYVSVKFRNGVVLDLSAQQLEHIYAEHLKNLEFHQRMAQLGQTQEQTETPLRFQ